MRTLFLFLAISLFLCVSGLAEEKLNEVAWSNRIHLQYSSWTDSAKEYRLWDGSRADVVADGYAIEVEWAEKQYEAFGQATWYAETLNKKPAVILLVKDFKTDLKHIYRAQIIGKKLGIPVWLVDTKNNMLIKDDTRTELPTAE
jgi:hypothetical protein